MYVQVNVFMHISFKHSTFHWGQHEYVSEKPPDKYAVSRFPGGYSNSWALPSAADSACFLREGSDCRRWWPLSLRPQHSSCCSDRHSDKPEGLALGRGDFDMSYKLFPSVTSPH
ncbi:hypothetical protein AVEN_217001-1 [Araneus ventricosus]|uniref:Uncharacterized protein n=1 Tax=Araneus ventricosus TaxID=182803 RepID=A0A4Y2MWS7_ARAVE|nr:hypothetical protein AVEN_217001-1 [Araneus ventricosus]